MILILGASGRIGGHLFNKFKEENFGVLGTYYNNKKQGMLHFDLKSMNLEDLELKNISHVIIAAATNANIDESKRQFDHSYNTNVVKTKKLLDYCFDSEIVPIYLSTDIVFDGEKGNYVETDKKNPINCYGKIKNEVENYMINSKKPNLILRMGRVFGDSLEDNTLLTSMLKKMKQKKRIECVVDQRFTPLYIEDLFNFTKFLTLGNYNGIFHLASCPTTTHYKIAERIKSFFNLETEIVPCTFNSLNLLEKRPKLIDLNTEKIEEITGYKKKPLGYFLNLIK